MLTPDSLLTSFEMPIIPLFSVSSLQETLFKFQRQLIATRRDMQTPKANPAFTLLPHCSLNPPIPEHPRNLLSDAFHSIAELSQTATTREGQAHIRQLVSEPNSTVADDILGFWEQEFLV